MGVWSGRFAPAAAWVGARREIEDSVGGRRSSDFYGGGECLSGDVTTIKWLIPLARRERG
jgi:hypothetical protein